MKSKISPDEIGIHQLIQHHKASVLGGIDWCPGESKYPGQNGVIFENRMAFSVSETACMLGLSVRTIERIIKRGELGAKRVGRRLLIPKNEFEAWLNRKE